MASVVADQKRSAVPTAASSEWRNDAFSFWKLDESWRPAAAELIQESESAIEWYLYERYLSERERRPPGLNSYYRLKSLIPMRMRHWLNASVARARKLSFPAWPCESALIELQSAWLKRVLERAGAPDAWHVAFWPEGRRCAIVLTHDVESPFGLRLMEQMADLEERYGFRSAWNIPLAQYPVEWKRVEALRNRGFEIGAHGLSHDGRLFRSREDFLELAPRLLRLAQEHKMRGFRSPSTLRNPEWIGSLDFDYDSSFSDTDPFEPQPGGSLSLFPFFIAGQMVELPYTMPQDHTLIHILRRNPLPIWLAKAAWIAGIGGMILTLVHPDYMGSGSYLGLYEELLKRLAGIDSAWRALPGEVAAWWRRRAQLKLHVEDGRPRIVGPDSAGAVARRVSDEPLMQ